MNIYQNTFKATIFSLLLSVTSVFAATYTLPAGFGTAPFTGCTVSGITYTCSSLTVPASSVINVTSSININGWTSIANNIVLNTLNGAAVTITATGILTVGNNTTLNANLVASGDNMKIGSGNYIKGNVTASGNSITYGTSNRVIGNATADAQTFGVGSIVFGLCSPVSYVNCINGKLIGDWHLDELSISGATGEFIENSGNAFNATMNNGWTFSGAANYSSNSQVGKTCNSIYFNGLADMKASTNTTMDTLFSVLASQSFSIWINPTYTPQTAGVIWHGANSIGQGLGMSGASGWLAKFYVNNVSISATSTASYSANTWTHVVAVYDSPNSLVSLYINGVLKATKSAAGLINQQNGNPIVIGSRGGATPAYFTGKLDEPLIFSGALTAAQVSKIYSNQLAGNNWDGSSRNCPVVPTVDHVEFVHNGSALTCIPKAITVLACTNANSCNNTPANQYTANTVTVTPTVVPGGQWCTDSQCATKISGSISVANNATIYLSETTAGSITLGGSVSGAATPTVQCLNTSTLQTNSTTACANTYASSGFLVSIPNHTSCASQNVTLQAVQSSATANTCVPAFQNVTKNVSLYSGYTNPTTGTKTASLNYVTTSGGATSAVPSLSVTSASPTTLTGIYFDATGTAKLTGFSYPDVGQVTLFPTYTGSDATSDAGLSMAAISGNTFIAAPASFSFGSVSTPQIAGNPFNVTVTANNGCATPAAAPNFGKETTPSTVSLTSTNPLPATGNSTPISQALSGFSSGVATANLTWKEVGTFDLVATTLNYLSSGLSASSTKSSVGRFIPSYFDTTVTPSCSTFSYSGQPFPVTVTARAAGGTTTANYAGATWAKAVTLSDANAVAGTFSANTIAATAFSLGVASSTSPYFTFTSPKTVPSTIKVKAVDTDGVTSLTGVQGTVYLLSGRLRMLNAYGNDLLPLPMSTQAQYWNGTGYVQNTLDYCTLLTVPTSSVGLTFRTLASGKTTAKLNGVVSGASAMISGDAGLVFSAPGARNVGYLDATVTAPSWLMYNWKGAGAVSPTGRASFGGYNSPFVYMRENF